MQQMKYFIAVLFFSGYSSAVFAQGSLRWGTRSWGETVWGFVAVPLPVPTLAVGGLAIFIVMVALITLLPGTRKMFKRRR
jgi:hypothetical protein